jgi:Uma2 family endonuclease
MAALRKEEWKEPEDMNTPMRSMTPQEFENFLESASERQHYELIGGTCFNMAPPTPEHQIISLNLASMLKQQLPRGSHCKVIQDVYARTHDDKPSVRPDILLTCSLSDWHPEHRQKKHHRIRTMRLAVEILSPSTEKYDLGEKLERYRECEALETLLIVHQGRALVECARRMQHFELRPYPSGDHLTFHAAQIQFNMDIDSIYDGLFAPWQE